MLTTNHFSNLNNKHYRKKSIATPVWGLAFFLTAAGSGGSAGPVRSARWRPWYQPITWTHTRTKHTQKHITTERPEAAPRLYRPHVWPQYDRRYSTDSLTHCTTHTVCFYETPNHSAEENSAAMIRTLRTRQGDSRGWSSNADKRNLSFLIKNFSL